MPGLATLAVRQFATRWPHHPTTAGLREILASCEQQALKNLKSMGVGNDEHGWQVLESHERVFQAMQRGDLKQVIERGEAALLKQHFVTAIFNNLSEAYFHSSRFLDALGAARRAAELKPDNLISQFNLVRFALLLGDRDEANRTADSIRSLRPQRFDFWSKLVGAFVLLERYDEALELAEVARQCSEPNEWATPDAAELHHAIAVALAHRGRLTEAEAEWRSALQVRPGFSTAQPNLDDLRRPLAERNGTFLFPLTNLIPRETLVRALEFLKPVGNISNEEHTQILRRFSEECPGLRTAIPLLLRIGDDAARDVGIALVKFIHTPELIEALRKFALSDCGSDSRRLSALNLLREVGAEIPQPSPFFSNGSWTLVTNFKHEIHHGPSETIREDLLSHMERGHAAIQRRDFRLAERCFREAIAIEPACVSAYNNVAVCLLSQQRTAEAVPMLRHVLTLDDNNAIARCQLARIAVLDNRLAEAAQWLEPLRCDRSFTTTEYFAMAGVDLELALRKGHLDGARLQLRTLETLMPDNPALTRFRSMLKQAEESAT